MSLPVNIDILRRVTEGDASLESELFKVFLASAKECLAALRFHCRSGDGESWRRHAHALKGISTSIGALHLANLCKTAQGACNQPAERKFRQLADIEAEFSEVERQLKNL